MKKVTFGFDEQISTREDISGIKRPKNLNFLMLLSMLSS